jgi:hypothetical protein
MYAGEGRAPIYRKSDKLPVSLRGIVRWLDEGERKVLEVAVQAIVR